MLRRIRGSRRSRQTLAHASVFTLLPLFSIACGSGALSEFGATQGGVQDMQLARDLIAEGKVPPAEAFVVEGMFSEHDLPLAGEACDRTLCIRAATAVAPLLDGEDAAFLQVGLSSTIDPASYEPAPFAIIATVDISGSMGLDAGEGSPGDIARALMHRIIDELRPIDHFAIVSFGAFSYTQLPLTPGDDKAHMHSVVDGLASGGSTDMESGMDLAYQVGRAHARAPGERVRVMVFTDVQPNVGETEDSAFEKMVRDAEADDDIETTVMACGLGVGAGGLQAMSHLRGANGFGVPTPERVDAVMEESWPWMLEAIAYDLTLDVEPPQGFAIGAGYGFPTADGLPTATLEVRSVFLSKKRGALLVRLDPLAEVPSTYEVDVLLSYEDREGAVVEEKLSALRDGAELDDHGQFASQPSARKAVALAILVEGMREAATLYAESAASAVEHIERVVARVESDTPAIDDDAFEVEVELARALRDLMVAGAEQGTLYGVEG